MTLITNREGKEVSEHDLTILASLPAYVTRNLYLKGHLVCQVFDRNGKCVYDSRED